MPRLSFDLACEHDVLGAELPDVRAAQHLAQRYASEVLRDGTEQPYWRMDVRQDSGAVLFSLLVELLPSPAAREREIGGCQGDRRLRLAGEQFV